MGIYVTSVEEIADEIKQRLDQIEGEVFKKDFKKACDKVIKEYEYWSDNDGNV